MTVIEFDHKSKKASTEWLTSVLNRNGYLTSGEVIKVVQKPRKFGATMAEFFELAIEYSPKFAGHAPANCLMKIIKSEVFQFGKKEAEFYELVRSNDASLALLASFGTAVDAAAQSAVVLLEEKRDDFYVTEWPLPPKIEACEQAVKALAAIHARWWNSPELGNEGFDRHDDEILNLPNERSRRFLALFFDALGDRLSKPRRAIVEHLYEHYPRTLKRRIGETNTQTLIHGDAHFWNVLLPKDASQTPIWIDWQNWGVNFGALDLAHMIGLHWFPERRHRFEKELLGIYLSELHRRDIDYGYDELAYDYRLQLAGRLFLPIGQWYAKAPAALWWPHLDRWFASFDDLDCRELLR